MTIDYSIRNIIPAEVPATANCYLWNMTQRFNFQSRGFIQVKLNLDRTVCDTSYDNQWDNMIWIPIANLIFSIASLSLIIKYFYDMSHIFDEMKRNYQMSQREY